jgi:hypothetical protein
MTLPVISSIVDTGMRILDKVIPDPAQREKAKLDLLKLHQDGVLKELESSTKAIVAEASSQDKWTSRARPTFMYVMYVLFLASIPMGILFAAQPEVATAVTTGVKNWLAALPEELYWLFGTGYLGYSAARSYDKSLATRQGR